MKYKENRELIPDTYAPDVASIDYLKLYDEGIRYALLDVDCTILPFDDTNVPNSLIKTFDEIRDSGIEVSLYSSNTLKRVKPVGDILNVNYVAGAKKPFKGNFTLVKQLFGDKATPRITMMIGDSFYLDMLFASRLGLYKVLVDAIKKDKFCPKTMANDLVQTTVLTYLNDEDFKVGNYYGAVKKLK